MKYAFIDRDGVLIFEPQDTFQIDSLEKLEILDGVIEALQKLQSAGYKLIMVSNQNGVGTESFPKEDFERPQARMLEIFTEKGVQFQRVFVCPHFASDNCNCRKPKTGLVDDFLEGLEIDRENSFMVGDRETDVQFGENIGVKGYRIKTNDPNGLLNLINQIL